MSLNSVAILIIISVLFGPFFRCLLLSEKTLSFTSFDNERQSSIVLSVSVKRRMNREWKRFYLNNMHATNRSKDSNE